MRLYTPEYIPEMDIFYRVVSPGQEQTFDQSAVSPNIEIKEIEIHGEGLSEELLDILLDAHEEHWREEILIDLKKKEMIT